MTLKARNRMLVLFFIIALLDAVLNASLFIQGMVEQTISFNSDVQRQFKFLGSFELLGYEPLAVCMSCLAFNAYVLIITAILYFSFEKTQALEAVYFQGFLLSCMAESSRLLIPLTSLAQSSPSSVAIISRIVIAARLLAPLAFLCAELFSDTESRQFMERNFLIMLLASIFMGILLPLDTKGFSSTFIYHWGLQDTFHMTRVLLVCSTLVAIVCKVAINYSTETIHEGIGFLMSISGYFILCNSDNYILLAVGATALFIGTLYYLHSIHQIYNWR
ncbi:MAG: hypothetical protein ILP18_10535 [Treponema sp.]|nr:hypothetical protein [Treponema sp.]